METGEVIKPAITGTTAMTAFSYLLAGATKNDFREPALLAKLLKRWGMQAGVSKFSGWLIHYSVGALFISIYKKACDMRLLRAGFLSGAVAGAVFGIVGIAGWSITLAMHSRPPKIQHGKFFAQLLPAHIIFGAVGGLTLAGMQKEENS